ncbi:MAG: GNAT family N-acetyltransferase [Betaproteobacteria bacterium]
MNDLLIRRLAPDDSVDDLTNLLHRAFAPLGRMGLACGCVAQSVATTAARIARGTCFVALRQSRIVGTVTVEAPDAHSDCAWYRRPRTASVHQFAVEPGVQHHGCGTRLLTTAQRWAAARGCHELALDTPQRAAHLVVRGAWLSSCRRIPACRQVVSQRRAGQGLRLRRAGAHDRRRHLGCPASHVRRRPLPGALTQCHHEPPPLPGSPRWWPRDGCSR